MCGRGDPSPRGLFGCAEALDEYFSRADAEKHAITAEKSAKIALSKHDKVRLDHERRINALQQAQDSSLHMVRRISDVALCTSGFGITASFVQAQLIESNMNEVDAAIEAVASLVASGMDWTEVGAVVKEERKKGNPVAELILSLDLEKVRNSLCLSLAKLTHAPIDR